MALLIWAEWDIKKIRNKKSEIRNKKVRMNNPAYLFLFFLLILSVFL
jgi:hypothetical protein